MSVSRRDLAGILGFGLAGGAPADAGPGPHLFIDDFLIESADGLRKTAHRAEKYLANPVIPRTEPWERRCITASGSVLFDGDRKLFQCWYQTYDQLAPVLDRVRLCYATSPDGVFWTKPRLGLFDFEGSKANNIVLHVQDGLLDTPIVIRDAVERDPARRYKLIFYVAAGPRRGLYGAVSADGIRWRRLPGPLIQAGDRASFFWNPFRKTYTVMTRPGFLSGKISPAPGSGVRRWIGLWESADFERYGGMQPVLWPDEADAEGTEFYSLQPFAYGPQAIGYLEMFYTGEQDPRQRRLNIQIVSSRDGLKWQRALDRKIFLQYGPLGAWDGGWVCPTSNPPIRVKDKWYVFFHGRQTLHWGTKPFSFEQGGETYLLNDPNTGHIGAIGLATMRVDGFASMDAGEAGGTLRTRLLEAPAARGLAINARAAGSVRVEVQDAAGRPLPGLSVGDCAPFTGDEVEHVVGWRGGRTLAGATPRPLRFVFELKNASLYSFSLLP